jgi:flavin-binding protein dodecin
MFQDTNNSALEIPDTTRAVTWIEISNLTGLTKGHIKDYQTVGNSYLP